MIRRYLIVLVAALAVTLGILFFMQRLVSTVTGDGDGSLYFLIQDFIPAPDRGRQLPERPPAPQAAPTRPSLTEPEDTGPMVPVGPEEALPGTVVITPGRPSVEGEATAEPALDPPAAP